MVRNVFLLIFCTIFVVIFSSHVVNVLDYFRSAYIWGRDFFSPIISGTRHAAMFKSALSLILVPVLITLVPVICYAVVKQKIMPHYSYLMWGVWLLLVVTAYYR